jgi:hypothetical protein
MRVELKVNFGMRWSFPIGDHSGARVAFGAHDVTIFGTHWGTPLKSGFFVEVVWFQLDAAGAAR